METGTSGTVNVTSFNEAGRNCCGGEHGTGAGYYHYAQGQWIACDAASDVAEAKSGNMPSLRETDEICPSAPRVLHSVGYWGFYGWMDLTNQYWGVFVHSWAIDMVNMFWISVCVSLFLATASGVAAVPAYRHAAKRAPRRVLDATRGAWRRRRDRLRVAAATPAGD